MIADDNVLDSQWLRQAFMTRRSDIDDVDRKRRVYTTAFSKYTDTTLGGNFTINNPPQFTRYADIKNKSPFSDSKGMGRYYSEAIDDNAVNVHLRFGVPEYNSMTSFLSNSYDIDAGNVARTGESKGILYQIGRLTGFLFALPIIPLVAASRLIKKVWGTLTGAQYSKFYYLKPTMHTYWGAVNTMVNHLAINMGLLPSTPLDSFNVDDEGNVSATQGMTPAEVETYNSQLPDIFQANGGIDIFSVATRAQRIRHRQVEKQQALLNSVQSEEDLINASLELTEGNLDYSERTISYKSYMEDFHKTELSNPPTDEPGFWSGKNSVAEHIAAATSDGHQWITLKVNPDRTISESFTNNTGESAIASKLNGMSSSARSARFTTLDGNIGDGAIAGALEGLIGGAKDILAGVADGVGLDGIVALGGNAFVDIPEHWQDSSADLPTANYTLELRAPYGNKMSIFSNLYVPLAMLLAGALPLSTGAATYTSPFICELFSKGRNQTRLGIIDSISITRGQGNIGWSVDQLPLGIDVTFSVKDLSTIVHMPLSDQIGPLSEDSAYTDYLAVLGSLGLTEQVYPLDRIMRNTRIYTRSFDKYTSPGYWGQQFAATLPGQLLAATARQTSRN